MIEDLFFKTENINEVEGIATILQNTLPSLGYKRVPGGEGL